MTDMQDKLIPASLADMPCRISENKLHRFEECFKEISIAEIEEERANFAAGHGIRSSVLKHISDKTDRYSTFPFKGSIEKIGSSWDGSKVGKLDEVDTLFVLDDKEITVHEGEGAYDFSIGWKGDKYNARQLNHEFANQLEGVLKCDPPDELKHNGYAAPSFSGVRVSGPAVTVLYQTSQQIDNIQRGCMVSVDITLALPFSCIKEEERLKIVNHIKSWAKDVIAVNPNTPIDIPDEPPVISGHVDGVWKQSTALIEVETFHAIDTESPIRRTYLLLKCLNRKVEKWNSKNDAFPVSAKSSELRSRLKYHVSHAISCGDIENLNQCMRHGYVLLSPTEREERKELPAKVISINTAAVKHILLNISERSDFKRQRINSTRVLELMGETLQELARKDKFLITNGIHPGFPSICKLSACVGIADDTGVLADRLLTLYQTLSGAVITLRQVCNPNP